MTSALCLLTTENLAEVVAALRSGRLAPPYTPLLLHRYVLEALSAAVAAELEARAGGGVSPRHLADGLDLVWTGPETPGVVNRDTPVVVREMFRSARESVLVVGYAVYQGHVVFRELADRMDADPGLRVRMFLDVRRPPNDHSSPSELVRAFADRFLRNDWPGDRPPQLYYDPRSLADDPAGRSSLHAKCVVVDREQAFVSSANFTEAAHNRNIEVGVYLRSPTFAGRLAEHVESLASRHVLEPIPLGRP